MKINLLRRILKDLSRKDVASSSKTRNLRVEFLENRELLDASNVLGVLTAPVNVGAAEQVAVQENVEAPVDLAGLDDSVGAENNDALTIDAPKSLKLDASMYTVASEKLKMSWDGVDAADGYRIEYTNDGGKNWRLSAVVDKATTEREATRVHTDLEYTFRIQAFNATSESEWTYSEAFCYAANLPKAPGKLQLGEFDLATGTLPMSWNKIVNASGYHVQYTTDGGATWRSSETLTGSDSTSRTATKVYTDREYQFRVCAYNNFGNSDWTYSAKFHTNYGELNNPAYMEIGEYDAATQKLATSWGAVDGADGYEVQYSVDRGKTWRLAQKLYGADTTSRNATHVLPSTTYEFRVRAFNNVGMSDWTYSDLYTPPAILPTPENFHVEDYERLTRRVILGWDDIEGEEGYRVEYSTNAGANWELAFKTEADVTEGVFEEVEPGVSYLFRMRAFNGDDVSEWTETSFYDPEAAYSSFYNTLAVNLNARI